MILCILLLNGKFFVINQRIDIALHGHASFNSVMRRVSLSFPWIYKCIIKFSYRNGSAHQGNVSCRSSACAESGGSFHEISPRLHCQLAGPYLFLIREASIISEISYVACFFDSNSMFGFSALNSTVPFILSSGS